jgi:hypothetical protein
VFFGGGGGGERFELVYLECFLTSSYESFLSGQRVSNNLMWKRSCNSEILHISKPEKYPWYTEFLFFI